MQELWNWITVILGLEANTLNLWQMVVRVPVVYLAMLIMIRLGERRFLGKNAVFDVILGIVLGSVVSRAITGDAPLFPTLGAGFALVGLHWLFARISYYSHAFGTVVKGNSHMLVEKGEILWETMRKHSISQRDLLEALRFEARLEEPSQVKGAWLERNGNISIIPTESKPKILEVKVRDGVQTVRIQLEP